VQKGVVTPFPPHYTPGFVPFPHHNDYYLRPVSRVQVQRSGDWKALFTSGHPKPATVQTVQPNVLSYAPMDRVYIDSLTNAIERTIKVSLLLCVQY